MRDRFLIRNCFLAFCAFLLCLVTNQEMQWKLAFAAGLLTLGAYQLAALHPYISKKGLHFHSEATWISGIMTGTALLAGVLLFPQGLYPPLFLCGVLAFLYFLQWPGTVLRGGLRSIFLVKNILVAVIWTWLTAAVPLGGNANAVVLTSRFFLILILTFGLDLRDTEADARRGIFTLPVLLGYTTARWIILSIAILVVISFASQDFQGKPAFLLTLLLVIVVIATLQKGTGYWKSFWLLDGNLLLHALFLMIFR